ncbi:MAG: aminotransferase class V-fold PLP-dependent enzyme [Trueperaceae bacterium]|nr:MAG: aminotransferase class V-fold PLP-dependent enzyme [Trueperaceae bacterium]
MEELLKETLERSLRYLRSLSERSVAPTPEAVGRLKGLRGPLPETPSRSEDVLSLLDDLGSPATVVNAGGRFFGFVNGGSLPVTVAANWLATAWDQNAGQVVSSPVAAALEEIALEWLVDVLSLPAGTGGGFVTGATMANFSALAAARHALLQRCGWDVEAEGLFGAPELRVVVGEEVHVSLLNALSLLGLGRERVLKIPVDDQGRMVASELPELTDRTILCLQAGNVNTGAFDPAKELCAKANDAGAWVHVDGAFGLWAAASPNRAHLVAGHNGADSWATDAHKWLNVPYDSGLVFCRDPELLAAAMRQRAAYLAHHEVGRQPDHFVPEMSRRARGVEVWAALRALGRGGLAEMIERTCTHAARFAEGLQAAGYNVLNDVELNQVLVSFGDPDITNRVIEGVQQDGTCWCGGTLWQGHTAMRISVSSWATSDEDVERSLDAILRIAERCRRSEKGRT